MTACEFVANEIESGGIKAYIGLLYSDEGMVEDENSVVVFDGTHTTMPSVGSRTDYSVNELTLLVHGSNSLQESLTLAMRVGEAVREAKSEEFIVFDCNEARLKGRDEYGIWESEIELKVLRKEVFL